MARVNVTLPNMLAEAVGARSVGVEADTIAGAFAAVRRDHPALAALIFDHTGAVRPHVLVFHKDVATRWMPTLDVPLTGLEELTVVQAISGG